MWPLHTRWYRLFITAIWVVIGVAVGLRVAMGMSRHSN